MIQRKCIVKTQLYIYISQICPFRLLFSQFVDDPRCKALSKRIEKTVVDTTVSILRKGLERIFLGYTLHRLKMASLFTNGIGVLKLCNRLNRVCVLPEEEVVQR